MTGFLVAGTSSDAGKSLVVTGLCRLARHRGIRVAPFKAQNMSNNSMVCPDGSEVGRAQYLQALAAGVVPDSLMNPVLLKPGSDRRSFIVVRGQPAGTLEAGEYATGRQGLASAAWAAYQELDRAHDLVICEGAGSPAEINLRAGDYTNMGLAQRFTLPVVLVGDIDRGGILASIYGTWGLLDDPDRKLLSGYLINKFRGDQSILDPGLAELTRRTGMPCLGVLPWLEGVWLDGEDSLSLESLPTRRPSAPSSPGRLRVAVIRLPRISNATDIDALAQEPGVDVVLTTDPAEVATADLVMLPGSRATVSDLTWVREQGLAEVLMARARAHRPLLGICGGFQMLAHTIDDPVEAGGATTGLALLPTSVQFHPEKVLRQVDSQWRGHRVQGYEIHHGRVQINHDAPDHEPFPGGLTCGAVWGTMWHGSLESDSFRRQWLGLVADMAGSSWTPQTSAPGFAARRESMIEDVAAAIEASVDVDALFARAR